MHAMVLQAVCRIGPDSEPLIAVDCAEPEPGPGEALIRVELCAVCHTELDQIEGRVATPLPRIPGHQVVGTVEDTGDGVDRGLVGRRVGVGWIASACGRCRWCERGEENLCPEFRATGRDINGGYAEFMCADAAFLHPLPEALLSKHAAPMLCAGAIGLRSLRLAGLRDGQTLGLTGFGASNHLVLALARALLPNSPVVVWARNPDQRRQALDGGARWAGDTADRPPSAPDAIVDTTPVWTPVLAALEHLAPGGRLVINAISKESVDRDKLAGLNYPDQLWLEKEIKSVANVTRRDIAEFVDIAARERLEPAVRRLPLARANEALRRIRCGDVHGAFVLDVADKSLADRSN